MLNNQIIDRKRFLKFALVGISGTIVDFSIFNFLSVFIGIPIIPSSIVSFLVAVINNFIWNRVWTYPESKKLDLSSQLTKFSIVSLMGLLIRTPLFALLETPIIGVVSKLQIAANTLNTEVIGHNIALATVIIVVLFWNYFINKKWTYKDIK